MDKIWQWAWDRDRERYSWWVFGLTCGVMLPICMLSALMVAGFEESGRYLEAAAVAASTALAAAYVLVQSGSDKWRPMERWSPGEPSDRLHALEATYTYSRMAIVRIAVTFAFAGGAMCLVVGFINGATRSRMIQYGIVGVTQFSAIQLVGVHTYVEAFLRPVRLAAAGDSGIGDALPRSRPSFAAWSTTTVLATAWVFGVAGALLAAVIDVSSKDPVVNVGIATALTLLFGVPITVGTAFGPSLQPIRDLAAGTQRVGNGDYSRRLPVVQDDDLGALAGSFNRMQAGLVDRERLRAAFGSYVDPGLATQLLARGDHNFQGERREVTVMFVDIRDFTSFAETNSAEDTILRLNALFEIVVPAVHDAGGHVNKYLGDGALAVFGAPNDIAHHADAAVGAALQIQQRVRDHFDGTLRIGVGINSGQVVVGTIGGRGKLEFTVIGDTVNVAARVEQLTKTTGDTILLTEPTLEALSHRPAGLTDRGAHALKGKAAAVRVHTIEPAG